MSVKIALCCLQDFQFDVGESGTNVVNRSTITMVVGEVTV